MLQPSFRPSFLEKLILRSAASPRLQSAVKPLCAIIFGWLSYEKNRYESLSSMVRKVRYKKFPTKA
jgi:hypothetical protein